MNEKIERILRIVDAVVNEDDGNKKDTSIDDNVSTGLKIVKPLHKPENEPVGYGNNKQVVAYMRNYGTYLRVEIVPISWLGYTPPPLHARQENDIQLPRTEAGIMPVFLCKQARKDVELSLRVQQLDPWKYITRATTRKKGTVAPYQMKQGVIYAVESKETTEKIYINFTRIK